MSLDKKQFRYVFDEYYQPLCNYAFKFTKDLDKAEDIVQDVFVKIWNRQHTFNENIKWAPYLFLLVKNQSLDVLRRDNLGLRVTKEYQYTKDKEVYLHVEENEKEIDHLLMLEKLYKSIGALPPKCSEVFTMNKLKGFTHLEIAERMGLSIKTVEAHMTKAYKLIKASMILKIIIMSIQ